MNYKDYQQVRNNVWKLLIDAEIKALPIKILTLCDNLALQLGILTIKQKTNRTAKALY